MADPTTFWLTILMAAACAVPIGALVLLLWCWRAVEANGGQVDVTLSDLKTALALWAAEARQRDTKK